MNKGVDYTYPLPKARLHARYDPVFAAFKRGQSCTLVGLPLSSRSAFFKFVLSQNELLKEFIDVNTYHFVVIEGSNLKINQVLEMIRVQLLQQKLIPETPLNEGDSISSTLHLQKQLLNLEKDIRIVIVLYEASEILKNPEINDSLTRLWNSNRTPPNSLINFCFIDSPKIYESNFGQLKTAIMETKVEFPLFLESEIEYTKKRLEFFSGKSINKLIHQKASFLSGGHYLIYKNLTALSEDKWLSAPIGSIVTKILNEYPTITDKVIPITKSFPRYWETNKQGDVLPQMTAQQRQVFDLLSCRTSEIVTRDEIAQTIWGTLWQKKYSDWAIDKLMSHLKKNLRNTNFSVLTLRNRGYQLIKN